MQSEERTVLWWGRFDPDYSRNRVLRQAFRQLGWNVTDFLPRLSVCGDLEATLMSLERPDLVWVPCFRQRDVAAARRWASARSIPLVFDPLISAYDKQVFERRTLRRDSTRARLLLKRESRLFQLADRVIADTTAHADYFNAEFGVDRDRLWVVPVGAEEGLFVPSEPALATRQIEALFFGTFIDLQGPMVIVEAAALCPDRRIRWTMLGNGPLRRQCEARAAELGLENLFFEEWVPYPQLPQRIANADILLGVFGGSGKAGRVIPNKVYQSLACGRPVVTRRSTAYPQPLSSIEELGLVQIDAANPQMLASKVMELARDDELKQRGLAARGLYERAFSAQTIQRQLHDCLRSLKL